MRKIGQLCIGGDWACAHGDIAALKDVAQQLAVYSHEPLHCEIAALIEACTYDPDRAAAAWPPLREKLFRASSSS